MIGTGSHLLNCFFRGWGAESDGRRIQHWGWTAEKGTSLDPVLACLYSKWWAKNSEKNWNRITFSTFFFVMSYPKILWGYFKYSPIAYPYTSLTSAIEKLYPLVSMERAALASHSQILPPPVYIFGIPQNDCLLKSYSFIHRTVVSYTTSVGCIRGHQDK